MLDEMYKTLNIEPYPIEDLKTGVTGVLSFMAILGMVWGTIGSGVFMVWVFEQLSKGY